MEQGDGLRAPDPAREAFDRHVIAQKMREMQTEFPPLSGGLVQIPILPISTVTMTKTDTVTYSQTHVDGLNKQIADLHIELSETRRLVIEAQEDRDEIAHWYSRLLISLSKDEERAEKSKPASPVFAAIQRTSQSALRAQVQPNISQIAIPIETGI